MKPLFSIIIPTYNRSAFILNTVNSVLSQQYDGFEVIVVDDGSTDDTEQVVSALTDPRVRYYKIVNSERGAARNFGAAKAKGVYLNFFDSDDTMYSNHLSTAAAFIQSNKEPAAFALAYEIKSARGIIKARRTFAGNINLSLVKGNALSCNPVFIRKSVFERYRFNEDRRLSALEDWELWLRVAVDHPILYSNTVSSAIIDHEERSVLQANPAALIARVEFFVLTVMKNENILGFFQKRCRTIAASAYTYAALHLALMRNNTKASISYLCKGIRKDPSLLFTRRTAAILKHLLL